jgi:hypothetical protein
VAAGEADQVVVAVRGKVLVLHLAEAEVGDADEALLLQPGEDAVDGGAADVREAGADEHIDLVGRVVRAGGLQGLQHEEALGREALTLGMELFDYGLIGSGLVGHRSQHLGREQTQGTASIALPRRGDGADAVRVAHLVGRPCPVDQLSERADGCYAACGRRRLAAESAVSNDARYLFHREWAGPLVHANERRTAVLTLAQRTAGAGGVEIQFNVWVPAAAGVRTRKVGPNCLPSPSFFGG